MTTGSTPNPKVRGLSLSVDLFASCVVSETFRPRQEYNRCREARFCLRGVDESDGVAAHMSRENGGVSEVGCVAWIRAIQCVYGKSTPPDEQLVRRVHMHCT